MPTHYQPRKRTLVQRSTGKRLKLGGYRPDPEDTNDHKYAANRYQSQKLPPRVDLRPYMTAVENQGELSSCTANAMAGAYEYLAKRLNGTAEDVSRLFIYYNARELDRSTHLDEGTYLRSCIKSLKKLGACYESTWPYNLDAVFKQPHDSAYEEAAYFLIEEYQRVDIDLYTMKHCLAEGYPFSFGLSLFSSFEKVGRRGRIPMPDPDNEEELGGHAMLCVGYSDKDQMFIVRNSWGSHWGDKGYCYIPYDYMTNSDYTADCWTIRSITDFDLSEEVWQDDTSLFEDDESEDEDDYDYQLQYEDDEDYDDSSDEEDEDYDDSSDEEDEDYDEDSSDEEDEDYDDSSDEDDEDYDDEDYDSSDEEDEDYDDASDEDDEDYDDEDYEDSSDEEDEDYDNSSDEDDEDYDDEDYDGEEE